MKKYLLLAMLLGSILPIMARDFTYNNMTYTVLDEKARTVETKAGSEEDEDGETKYVAGNSAILDVVIPETVKDGDTEYTVTKIGDYGFVNNLFITSLELPNTLKEIGEFAFFGLMMLEEINIPDSVETLNDACFSMCLSAKSLKLPQNLEEMGMACFMGLTKLEELNLPETLTSINALSFSMCNSLKRITIPKNVLLISMNAFNSCETLEVINLPENLMFISKDAFTECPAIKSIYYDVDGYVASGTKLAFDNDTYKGATLYVPEGQKQIVEKDEPWSYFLNVVETNNVGIENVGVEVSEDIEYFDLNGIRVIEPQKGDIVIRRQGNKVNRIVF